MIRQIDDADIESVIALWNAAGITRPWNDPARDIAFARRNPHSTLLVSETEGAIVATIMVGEDGHRGWVYYLAVDPGHQRSGLGRSMMVAAEDWLRVRGVWKLQLMVREDNLDARGFYERLGYAEGRVTCFQREI